MANIAYYGSHNAAFAVEQDGKIISVIEVERFNGYKNSGIAQYKTPKHKGYSDFRDLVESIMEYVKDDFGIERFENCIVMNSDLVVDNVLLRTHDAVPADNYLSVGIEIAALSALAAVSVNMGRFVYFPFIIVTFIQMLGTIQILVVYR